MKNKILSYAFALVLMLSISVSNAFPKNYSDNSHYYPLLLNGKVADIKVFSWMTRGKLSLGVGNPETGSKSQIPFYAYIMRAGRIIDSESFSHNLAVTEIELAEILKSALDGDQIFVDPVGKYEEAGRRVIVVKQKQLMFNFDWWLGRSTKKNKDGC